MPQQLPQTLHFGRYATRSNRIVDINNVEMAAAQQSDGTVGEKRVWVGQMMKADGVTVDGLHRWEDDGAFSSKLGVANPHDLVRRIDPPVMFDASDPETSKQLEGFGVAVAQHFSATAINHGVLGWLKSNWRELLVQFLSGALHTSTSLAAAPPPGPDKLAELEAAHLELVGAHEYLQTSHTRVTGELVAAQNQLAGAQTAKAAALVQAEDAASRAEAAEQRAKQAEAALELAQKSTDEKRPAETTTTAAEPKEKAAAKKS